ncbi:MULTISPECIES: Hsp33 family molecular chaperone HslO [unclassified Massilia]|uniref:Hsp33 family molecular chaperone HslO n=1 Tax=unclassified Massilia TaxID=2609279 RepID=UPI001782DCBE|nr:MULTISPECIES: Hsp33 family molecular chaperone HslO [unclassified Massilia]MBD8530348.1 Hsp33 family molecular chaperone HslO [Massilia sp. CFBP 13647]MBD8673125.1 Hsp33 family molecular chaperone HslO [Massilia sp. CFBP 13721]
MTTVDTKDTLQKFIFDNAAVRGELVEISDTWREIQARHGYPKAVRSMLGEMVAAAALLSANLKFNGSIVMQIHGDGPVRLLVVECDADLRIRATAKLAPDAHIVDDAGLTDLLNVNRRGRFVITLDPLEKMPGQQPYQGIVPLDGDSVATVIENYMLRSEQMDTKLWLAADDKVSRGLLLQKLPRHSGKDDQTVQASEEEDLETWHRAVMLGQTLKQEELLTTNIETLLNRLFWEETIRVFDPQHPQFHCSCTREKVGNMLKMLGQPEVESALADLGELGINCDFCGKHYAFDKVDCAQLFATATTADALVPAPDIKH